MSWPATARWPRCVWQFILDEDVLAPIERAVAAVAPDAVPLGAGAETVVLRAIDALKPRGEYVLCQRAACGLPVETHPTPWRGRCAARGSRLHAAILVAYARSASDAAGSLALHWAIATVDVTHPAEVSVVQLRPIEHRTVFRVWRRPGAQRYGASAALTWFKPRLSLTPPQSAEADLESLLAGGLATCNGGPSAAVWSPSFLSLSTTVPARQFDVVLPTAAGDAPLAVGADRSRLTAVDNGDGTATYWVLSAAAGLLRLTHRVGPLAQYVCDPRRGW